MNITFYHKNSGIPKKDFGMYDKFVNFLQKNYPLKHDIVIYFLDKREKNMTTGKHGDKHDIKVLSKNRMNRDIMRSLTHEWIHEYEQTIMKFKHKKDIGGKDENIANAESGKAQKKFEKEFPKFKKSIFS